MSKPMNKKEPSYVVRPPTAVLTRGFDPALSLGSARPAVFRASTYVFASPEAAERAFAIALGKQPPPPGERGDLIYSRLSHPNAEILEDQIVPLEKGARAAAVFNSGMAAISTIFLSFCAPGWSVVQTRPVYGGTQHMFNTLLRPLGIAIASVGAGDGPGLDKAIAAARNLRVIYLETPANPTLMMVDIKAAVAAARRHPDNPLVVVDNTFLGPCFQHPLELGVDLVVYSATKYLNGFSDMIAGVVQSKNAQRIAESLVDHPAVRRVIYPSLFDDPEQIRIRDAQCDFPGGIMTLDLRGGRRAAFDFLRSLKILRDAVSLGGVESLACHPRTTTHSENSPEELEEAGITESLVRISIGVEDWRDLQRDIREALDAIG